MKHSINTLITIALICSITCFTCPEGKNAKDNGAAVNPNGCGPAVTNSLTKVSNTLGNYFGDNFEGCCNVHDQCYGKCGADKKGCDSSFYSCMKNKCNKKNALSKNYCKLMAKSFYELVDNFGSKFFENSQKEHCDCV